MRYRPDMRGAKELGAENSCRHFIPALVVRSIEELSRFPSRRHHTEPLARTGTSRLLLVGDDNFTWDSDYPHPDGTFPWGVAAMLKQPLSQDSKRKLLWDNAARVFNLR